MDEVNVQFSITGFWELDIKSITVVDSRFVNERLSNGEILLGVGVEGNLQDGVDIMFTFGELRSQFCGALSFGHTAPKSYDHEKGKWYCSDCKKEEEQRKLNPVDDLPF